MNTQASVNFDPQRIGATETAAYLLAQIHPEQRTKIRKAIAQALEPGLKEAFQVLDATPDPQKPSEGPIFNAYAWSRGDYGLAATELARDRLAELGEHFCEGTNAAVILTPRAAVEIAKRMGWLGLTQMDVATPPPDKKPI